MEEETKRYLEEAAAQIAKALKALDARRMKAAKRHVTAAYTAIQEADWDMQDLAA